MQTRIIYFLTYPTAHSQSLRFFSLDLNERYETLLKDKSIVDALYHAYFLHLVSVRSTLLTSSHPSPLE